MPGTSHDQYTAGTTSLPVSGPPLPERVPWQAAKSEFDTQAISTIRTNAAQNKTKISKSAHCDHRQGSTQATPWRRARIRAPLSRELGTPALMPSFRLSMRQQWFTHVRLLVTHLTR